MTRELDFTCLKDLGAYRSISEESCELALVNHFPFVPRQPFALQYFGTSDLPRGLGSYWTIALFDLVNFRPSALPNSCTIFDLPTFPTFDLPGYFEPSALLSPELLHSRLPFTAISGARDFCGMVEDCGRTGF